MNLHSLLGNIRKKNLMAASLRRQKKHRARLRIDTLEERAVPAVLPAPVVDQTSFRSLNADPNVNDGWAPAMAADPNNPNQIFAAYVTHASTGTRIEIVYSTNGGTTWSSQGFIENHFCPRPHNPPVLNSDVSDPSVAWDRFGNVWLTYTEDHDAHTAGLLVLRKYRFSGAPFQVDVEQNAGQQEKIMYSWVDGAEVYAPNIAIDSNRPFSEDPVLAPGDPQGRADDPLSASQLDEDSVKVFLTYSVRPAAAGVKTGANAVVLRYSANGGQTWQAPLLLNDEGFQPLGQPDVVFSDPVFTPGRANEPDSGGRMITVMSRGGTIRSDSISFSGTNGTPGLEFFSPWSPTNITNATQDVTGTVTIETTTPHNFTVGTFVQIAGVSVFGYNGNFTVTNVLGANQFQYTTAPGLAPGVGGTATRLSSFSLIDGIDPGGGAPHVNGVTTININVPPGAVPKIDNVSLDLRINHPNLSELDVVLRAPNGAQVQLFLNRITNGGTDQGAGTGLAGTSMNSTFVDSSPQTINQGAAPYQWFWAPQQGSLDQTFTGLTPAQFQGNWQIIVRDHRASNAGSVPVGGATLWLGQAIRARWVDSSGVVHRGGTDRNTGAGSAVADDRALSHPSKPAFAPNAGVGPGLVATVDSTVGAFSPYQNRTYFAFSTGGSVQVMYTDGVDTNEGSLWSTAPTTVDSGYLPQIAVDPSTGALYVAYYSSKFDASGSRSTMMLSSAINMPDYKTRSPNIEFAPGTWVTPQETAFDQVRTKLIEVEPVPSNGPSASDVRMWGNSIGMTIFDSHVVLVYPGNLNNTGSQLRTQDIEVTGGPRVVWTDSGPILGDAFISGNFDSFDYNLETGDGRNSFSGFGVEFDRIIDPATFNPDDVKVIFRGPEDDPVGPGTEIAVDSINRLDEFHDPVDQSDYGSKRFFVLLDTPQTAVGTYSLFIGADSVGGITSIKDRVRDQKFTYTPNGEVKTFNYPPTGTANDQIEDFAGGATPLNTVINIPAPTSTNISTASQFGNTVTIQTLSPHGFSVGTSVLIAGVSEPGYDGTFTITNVLSATQFQYSTTAGLLPGTGGTASGANAFSPGTVIFDITVRVNITHEQVSDLQLDLIAPNGQTVRLVNQFDAFGFGIPPMGFQDTEFNDGATLSLAGDFEPYTGVYVPAESLLAKLFGDNPAGNGGDWTLRITDMASGDTGVLNSWGMTIVGASTPSIVVGTGNFMDQDGDGVANESPISFGSDIATQDGYALPNPVPIRVEVSPNVYEPFITPFRLPYSNISLPIVIPGPRLLESRVQGQPASTDQLAKDTAISSIDLYFDRVIDATTFSSADVVRITGPLGDIPLTGVTVVPVTSTGVELAAGTDSEYFRIKDFAAQNLSGTYTIQLGSQIADTAGNLLDTNFNAGVGNLVGNVSGADVTTEPFGGDPLNGGLGFNVPAKGTTTVNLDISDGFALQRATTNLTVVFPSLLDPDGKQIPTTEYNNLEGRLIAPDGTTILLFINSPISGQGNMTNLTFTDDSFVTPTTPPGPPISIASIEDGFVANGFNNPNQPLAQLINHGSQGTWKLQIRNKGNVSARVDKFALELDKPVIPSGLGEEIADRTVVSFRIANTDGSTVLSKSNWSPVGPAPQIDLQGKNSTAGRVASIAVDPSDPSGNTVYAAGASGGVWRTTNFLTRDPDGPVWVPLTDFGPNNAINVGNIAVYNSKTDPNTNGDPEKTVILVGTGSASLNVIDEEDDRRFDGVGFLLSEDAGRTWQVLDSTSNYDDVLNKFRPFTDTEAAPTTIANATQVGTTVTIQTATPHAYPVGTVVDIQGVSVAGYNGTGFVVTGVPGPNHFTYTTTAGLAAGTGGTSQAFDRRNHFFVGTVVNKIVFEKNPNVFTNRPIIWAAVGQGITPASANMAGLWRSIDGARTWTQVLQGEATDFVLAPGSQLVNSNDRPTIGYVAIQGQGTYFISNLDSDLPTFTLMNGGVGRPTVNGGTMTVLAPTDTPIGNFGRIAIATPAFVRGNALANVNYQHWLYVAVSNQDGTFRGLYMTKDRGDNWTRVKLTGSGGFSDAGVDVDVMINPSPPADDAGGNHSITLAVDPNDANIVYFGSNALIKVDTTLIADPYNTTLYNHSNNEGGIRPNTFDGLQGGTGGGGFFGLVPGTATYQAALNDQGALNADPVVEAIDSWNHLNIVRNSFSPFSSDTALSVSATNFQNNGRDVRWVLPGGSDGEGVQDFNWVSQIITFIDPITGMARVAFGTDEGITSFVIDPDVKPNQVPIGTVNQMNGFNQHFQVEDNGNYESDIQVNGKRNGNLQVARLYSGDVQPSLLAASIAQSLLYGAARRLGDVQVSPADPAGGAIVWDDSPFGNNPGSVVGRLGRANYVAADQTGSGNVYILRRIDDIRALGGNQVNFFQISKNGGAPISFTNGLFSTAAGANFTQWTNQSKTFAVNPIDPNGIVMGSSVGRVYVTRNMGLTWDYRGEPGTLDGTIMTAFAYGAPNPGSTNLNDYIYAGSTAGNIWVTKTGGGDINVAGDLDDSWVDIVGGIWGNLDGSPIQKIVPNPTRGSNELFAVTRKGIYRMEDWDRRDPSNPSIRMPTQWEDITTNIRTITSSAYGLGDEWVTPVLGFDHAGLTGDSGEDPITTIAVDWRPTFSPALANPVIYVGGDGGVFRAVYNGNLTTWARFTGTTEGAASDGGGLPLVKITDIDLALGNIDPNTGRPITNGAPDAVIASTLGRGMWAIGLDVPPGVSGPRVIASTPSGPLTSNFTSLTVTFDKGITGGTFTAADVTVTSPTGQNIAVDTVIDVTPLGSPPEELQTVWEVTLLVPQAGDGTYTVRIGPDIASGAARMDQDGDANNGEATQDQFVMSVIVGRNDLADFVRDTYVRLLNRQPTTAEFLLTTVKNMDTARLTSLATILKELIGVYNSNPALNGVKGEARIEMIERFARIPGGPVSEIGNLIPGFNGGAGLAAADVEAYAEALKKGQKTPQLIMAELIATTDVTKPWNNFYFETKSGNSPATFLANVYADLFPGLGINPATMLPTTTYNNQLAQAGTPNGRFTLVRNLVNGATVTYYPAGYPTLPKLTTSFRIHFVDLAYAKYLPGYTPTSAELTSARSLMAKPLAANQLQGAEWVFWKILSSKPYFDQQTQSDGLPDDGLHTNRSWVESVIDDRMYRAADQNDPATGQPEVSVFSQKVLDKFKTQRAAFVRSVLFSTDYRTIKINEYFQLVHDRLPTPSEMTTWLTNLKNGSTYAGLIANRLGTKEFYDANTSPPPATAAVRKKEWAQEVYQRLLSRPASPTEESALVAKIASTGSRAGAAASVVNGFGSTTVSPFAPVTFEFRRTIVAEYFQLFLGRAPSANEMDGYLTFLKTNRWENVVIDMLANGLAKIPGSPATLVATGLPREFWEVVN